jgi:hypothetical protein
VRLVEIEGVSKFEFERAAVCAGERELENGCGLAGGPGTLRG